MAMYCLVLKIPFKSPDDIAARQTAGVILEAIALSGGPVCQDKKLQEIFPSQPPRPVLLESSTECAPASKPA